MLSYRLLTVLLTLFSPAYGYRLLSRRVLCAGAGAALLSPLRPAGAGEAAASPLCAPAVSVLRLPETEQMVVLVGTAHISEDSANLVRQVIRSLKPEAVMVELDAGRASKLVSRIGASAVGPAGDSLATPDAPKAAIKPSPVPASSQSYSMGGVARRLMRGDTEGAGAEAVGLAISQLYKNLDSLGFKSGGEFVAAIEEAKALGATVVLGDQDASVTLGRLRDAIQTLARDGTLERLAAEASAPPPPPGVPPPPAPPALRRLMARTNGALGGGEGMLSSLPATNEAGKVLESRESVEAALAVMQERDNVRALVDFLQETVPPLHQALIAERDAYLARSLRAALADTGAASPTDGNDGQIATRAPLRHIVVGVVGLAHMDGIEAALMRGGPQYEVGRGLVVPALAGVVRAKPATCGT